MVNKVLFILACIMVYAFIFIVETYSIVLYNFVIVGGFAVVKGVLNRGIVVFLLSHTALIIGLVTKSMIKFLGRVGGMRLGKYLMHRYNFVRGAIIAGIMWYWLAKDDIDLWWKSKSISFKLYVGAIFAPITLTIFSYIFIVKLVRVYIMRKIAESGLVKVFEKIVPKSLQRLGRNIDRKIKKIAQRSVKKKKK